MICCKEIRDRAERKERVLVTTLTKRMAEDLTQYYQELGVKVRYLHSDIDTLERIEILRDLRRGDFDVLVGINLLREGLDLPEVSLVAILDADKEGFLRSGRRADPDLRPRRPQRQRPGDHVCRQGHRLDAVRRSTKPSAAGPARRPTTRSTASRRPVIVKAIDDVLIERLRPRLLERAGSARGARLPHPGRTRRAHSRRWTSR